MLTADARRADADDAVVRAWMAQTVLHQARERLAAHKLELEPRRAIADARRRTPATRSRRDD